MAKTNLTAELLRELLHYAPDTGDFTWKVDAAKSVKKGSAAGYVVVSGYLRITVRGGFFKAHRLAWLYVYGKFPDGIIDHINGIKLDNRISNLRDVSNSTNAENQKAAHRGSRTGFLGVTWSKGRYEAYIKVKKVGRYIGRYDTPEEAHEAYLAEKRRVHVGCTI